MIFQKCTFFIVCPKQILQPAKVIFQEGKNLIWPNQKSYDKQILLFGNYKIFQKHRICFVSKMDFYLLHFYQQQKIYNILSHIWHDYGQFEVKKKKKLRKRNQDKDIKNKKKSRTLEVQGTVKIKNIEPRPIFTGSYKISVRWYTNFFI